MLYTPLYVVFQRQNALREFSVNQLINKIIVIDSEWNEIGLTIMCVFLCLCTRFLLEGILGSLKSQGIFGRKVCVTGTIKNSFFVIFFYIKKSYIR